MKLGDASTPAEQAAEAAIAMVPQWRGKEINYERIAAGITNINWRITVPADGKRYFMKIPGAGTEVFIDRRVAKEAALKIADTGYAPRLVHYDDDKDIEVQEYLEGFRSCNVSDLLDPVIRANIVKAYRRIHETQTLSIDKAGFDQLQERLAQARQYGAVLPRDLDRLLEFCERAREKLAKDPPKLCACYNDGYVSNYMVDDAKNVRIIDWEYAGNNDPYWDLSMLAFESFFKPEVVREMIELHDGHYSEAAEARVRLNAGVIGVTWGCWAALQSKISTIPFDFAKYSDLIFLRTRFGMSLPDWDRALAAL
jgi:thiamine kinase-like enzyme